MQQNGWATALAVIFVVVALALLLETAPKIGGIVLALVVLILLARGMRSGNIEMLNRVRG